MTEEIKEEVISMDIQQIMEMLPHRYPFLLVDRITECIPGKYSKGYKNMTMNEGFFQGHFREILLCLSFAIGSFGSMFCTCIAFITSK